MKPLHLTIAAAAGAGFVLALAVAPAMAQRSARNEAKTPDDWSYRIENGRRVPKGNRTVGADGSWKEELKDGPCLTVREKSAPGEYREVRKCD